MLQSLFAKKKIAAASNDPQ